MKTNKISAALTVKGIKNVIQGDRILVQAVEKMADIPFKDYATPVFLKYVKEIEDNGNMNMYVDEAISKKVSSQKLEKEIKQAINQHRKWNLQPGSSARHALIVVVLTHLLGELRKAVKEFQEKST